MFSACNQDLQNGDDLGMTQATLADGIFTVSTESVRIRDFPEKIISNGKILAMEEVPGWFQTSGIVSQIFVANGQNVKKGQPIAALENTAQKLALAEAHLALDESLVELNDLLISQGGKSGDSLSVSREVYSYIKLKSGFKRAIFACRKADFELSKTFLNAPIDGIIANFTISQNTQTPVDKPVCVVLNHSKSFVRCSILESELGKVSVGQSCLVEPISEMGAKYRGVVTTVNPQVGEHGLAEVMIVLQEPHKGLLSGMNAKVTINRILPRQIVVPKRAVVSRDGRYVVFTHKGGRANWNYVSLGDQNDSSAIIRSGLSVGQEIIVSGNLNLAHNSKVRKRKAEEISE